MIVIKKFIFNPFSENTYVIWNEDTFDAIIVDPGCFDNLEEQRLSDFIKEKGITPKYIFITHSHIDHILGLQFLMNEYGINYMAPEEDMPLLENADKQAAAFGIEYYLPPVTNEFISEDKKIKLGQSEVSFIHTPGHSPGEYCIYFSKENFILSGDVLFKGTIGRTDLWGGEYNTLISSIKLKLFNLPDETVVYPGHGENTTIGAEKRDNPFLNQ